MNVLSYPPILDSYSTLMLREEVDAVYPIGNNKWIGIYDEPENIIEKYIQDSFDFYLKDKYQLWQRWDEGGIPVGFEWWIHDTMNYNTITFHSNHDDTYRREECGVMKYPLLSTETYLTNNEDPTIILDTQHGNYWEEFINFPPTAITYSVPEEGKFLVTDPRYIRGVFDSEPNRLSLHYDVWNYKPKNLNRLGISSRIFDCRFYKEEASLPVEYLGRTKKDRMNLWQDYFDRYQPTALNSGETWKVTQ
ncbi:hypothetical protein PHM2_187 [Prochlorococcus phage P-HM2]|uniref:Uncharacterized protein n=1 Tax=Prochlorococcus phage P-HM2 TaxID=445696 RepID=E3ST37_9CAUD|nr:hypothetical protein PHM2_187 [Prochlorococcus phage P-HM2]ADO99965.1 hypothetical protein PHM2_187 [Prochlorococcus phage P-HM2]